MCLLRAGEQADIEKGERSKLARAVCKEKRTKEAVIFTPLLWF